MSNELSHELVWRIYQMRMDGSQPEYCARWNGNKLMEMAQNS